MWIYSRALRASMENRGSLIGWVGRLQVLPFFLSFFLSLSYVRSCLLHYRKSHQDTDLTIRTQSSSEKKEQKQAMPDRHPPMHNPFM